MSAPKIQNNSNITSPRTVSGIRPAVETREEPFGTYLMRERELRGIPLAQIADETRILEANLRALEEDDRSRLPERVFVLGYIRAYAKAIGIDPNEAVLRYDEYTQSREPPPPSIPIQRSSPKDRHRHIAFIVAILAVVLAVFACLKLVMNLSDETAPLPPAALQPADPKSAQQSVKPLDERDEAEPPSTLPQNKAAGSALSADPKDSIDVPDPTGTLP